MKPKQIKSFTILALILACAKGDNSKLSANNILRKLTNNKIVDALHLNDIGGRFLGGYFESRDKVLEKLGYKKLIPKGEWDPKLSRYWDEFLNDADTYSKRDDPSLEMTPERDRAQKIISIEFVNQLSKPEMAEATALCIRNNYTLKKFSGGTEDDFYLTIEVRKDKWDEMQKLIDEDKKLQLKLTDEKSKLDQSNELKLTEQDSSQAVLDQAVQDAAKQDLMNQVPECSLSEDDTTDTDESKYEVFLRRILYHELMHCVFDLGHLPVNKMEFKEQIMAPTYSKMELETIKSKWKSMLRYNFCLHYLENMPKLK